MVVPVPSELVADCFELARDIRELDMRASPYDFVDLRLDPASFLNRGASAFTLADAAALFRRIGVDRVLFGTNYAISDPQQVLRHVSELPLTTTGKIMRRELRRMDAERKA